MVRGDPGVESIYNWTQDGQEIAFRGANGQGDGVHILTGQYQALKNMTVVTCVDNAV